MKLKRLDIHGFKSFYHRTTLIFDDGITGIVGPNGCGKSNVVDAIKWVMGEQGPRSLRGSAMEDVIFNGSEKRGPMGICEVKLTFINDESVDIPARWHGVAEIAIERRMERGKGSDYFINGQRCRLSDLHDIVAGTGVGAGPGGRRAYAIIEQGQIDRIVSAKADERRLLIEEVAGITRYRHRRRLAERKMLETRQNIERVDDIVGEIEKQMRSLSRQAKKAERYRQYRDEARGIGLKIGAFEYFKLESSRKKHAEIVKNCLSGEADSLRAVEAGEARRAATLLEAKRADEVSRELSENLRKLEEAARLAAERLVGYQREREMLLRQLERAQQDVATGEGRRTDLEEEITIIRGKVAALEAAVTEQAGELAAKEVAQREAAQKLLDSRALVERLIREESEEMQTIARARADREVAEQQGAELARRVDSARAQKEEIDGQLSAHAEEEALARSNHDLATAETAACTERVSAARNAREEMRVRSTALQETDRELAEQMAASRARLKSLEEVERGHSELTESARTLLEAGVEGIEGAVSAIFDVAPELERAVAAALGPHLNGVVVSDEATALSLSEQLKSESAGRCLFGIAGGEEREQTDLPTVSGVKGRLVDLLEPREHVGLVSHLLDGALLVEDLDVAFKVAADGWLDAIVTLDGERLEGGALLTGGSSAGDGGPLSYRRQIRSLGEELAKLEEKRQAILKESTEIQTAMGATREGIDKAVAALDSARVFEAECRKDVQQVAIDGARFKREAERAAADFERMETRIAETQAAGVAAAERAESAESGRADRRKSIGEAEKAVSEAEIGRDAAVSALHLVRAESMTRKDRLEGVRASLARFEKELSDIDARRHHAASMETEFAGRLTELDTSTKTDTATQKENEAKAAEMATKLADARNAHRGAEDAVVVADNALESARQSRDASRSALSDARLELETVALRTEALEARIRDRYQVVLSEIAEDFREETAPTEDAVRRYDELEVLIERMGEVNVTAIEEFEAVEERHTFLTAQRTDLVGALEDLELAIGEIDRTSKALFKTTFEAVNGHFTVLFPRLFRGGRAELLLTDPDDLLATGIEMKVQPPGKKLQSVDLLSGGEKAMCAIALVFAVFRHRPSPFCLLDEVDAPLDDANIGRFNEVVREMSESSQVVLVTHNKRTMEIGDALYGVTMEEPGISKLVGVRMT